MTKVCYMNLKTFHFNRCIFIGTVFMFFNNSVRGAGKGYYVLFLYYIGNGLKVLQIKKMHEGKSTCIFW